MDGQTDRLPVADISSNISSAALQSRINKGECTLLNNNMTRGGITQENIPILPILSGTFANKSYSPSCIVLN